MDRRERNHQWYSRFDERSMVLIVEVNGVEVEIPAKYEVCGTCGGQGKHVNPSIDSHGLTASDFDEDPDLFENYMSGMYDVPCVECHGNRVVPCVADHASAELQVLAEERQRDLYELEAAYEAERRFGA